MNEIKAGIRAVRKERRDMSSIRPVSDLQNYNEVLRDVAAGAPVFLTTNRQKRYVILDITDYEQMQAALRLMNELSKGRRSGEEESWLSLEEMEEKFLK